MDDDDSGVPSWPWKPPGNIMGIPVGMETGLSVAKTSYQPLANIMFRSIRSAYDGLKMCNRRTFKRFIAQVPFKPAALLCVLLYLYLVNMFLNFV